MEPGDERKPGRGLQNTDSRRISSSYVGLLVLQAVLTSLACGNEKWHAVTQPKIRSGQANSTTQRAAMPHSFGTATYYSSQGRFEISLLCWRDESGLGSPLNDT
jgi:hypothetical protein